MNTTTEQPVAITAQDTLNLIVARYPQTLPVLQRFGLDTCCGGPFTLATAAGHHGLDLQEVIMALGRAIEEKA